MSLQTYHFNTECKRPGPKQEQQQFLRGAPLFFKDICFAISKPRGALAEIAGDSN